MPTPGLYLTNATGESVPVLTEDGHADTSLLVEAIEENTTEHEQAETAARLQSVGTDDR